MGHSCFWKLRAIIGELRCPCLPGAPGTHSRSSCPLLICDHALLGWMCLEGMKLMQWNKSILCDTECFHLLSNHSSNSYSWWTLKQARRVPVFAIQQEDRAMSVYRGRLNKASWWILINFSVICNVLSSFFMDLTPFWWLIYPYHLWLIHIYKNEICIIHNPYIKIYKSRWDCCFMTCWL